METSRVYYQLNYNNEEISLSFGNLFPLILVLNSGTFNTSLESHSFIPISPKSFEYLVEKEVLILGEKGYHFLNPLVGYLILRDFILFNKITDTEERENIAKEKTLHALSLEAEAIDPTSPIYAYLAEQVRKEGRDMSPETEKPVQPYEIRNYLDRYFKETQNSFEIVALEEDSR